MNFERCTRLRVSCLDSRARIAPMSHLSSNSFFHSQVESDERCNIRSEIVY